MRIRKSVIQAGHHRLLSWFASTSALMLSWAAARATRRFSRAWNGSSAFDDFIVPPRLGRDVRRCRQEPDSMKPRAYRVPVGATRLLQWSATRCRKAPARRRVGVVAHRCGEPGLLFD